MDFTVTEAGKAPDQSTIYEIRHHRIEKDIYGNDVTLFGETENVTRQQLLDAKQSHLNEAVEIDLKLAEIDKII